MAEPDRVAVLGGGGFVGSHTADALSEAGYLVRVVDQQPSRYLRGDQEMTVCDITDREQVLAALDGCRYVYHFAGIADIGDCARDPRKTAEVNVLGTVNVLDAAVASGCERFVFASTVYVYSGHGAFYRASKQSAEAFIQTYQEQYGLDYTVLRYGTLYGRRADRRNRIHQLLRQGLETGEIKYQGSGEAVREFIHVRDAARMSVKVLDPQYANRHLVLTGQEKLRIQDLLLMIREMMNERVEVDWANGEPTGHYHLTPYSFMPQIGHKLVPEDYIDLGQGLMDTMGELLELHHEMEEISIDQGPAQGSGSDGR